jgi:hypothetical protein
MANFKKELENLINKHSVENGSNTPDYILAEYLVGCLQNFSNIMLRREHFFGRELQKEFVDEKIFIESPPKACKPDKTPNELAQNFIVEAAVRNFNNKIYKPLAENTPVTAEQLLEDSDLSYKVYKQVKDILTKTPECYISPSELRFHNNNYSVIFNNKKYRLVGPDKDWEITLVSNLPNCPLGHNGKTLPPNHKILQITITTGNKSYKATQEYNIGDRIQEGIIESFRLTSGYPQAVILGSGKLVDVDDFRKV